MARCACVRVLPLRVAGDGIDLWPLMSGAVSKSPRTEAIIEAHPLDDPEQVHGNALIVWPMKIIKVVMQNNEPGWYPPPGQDPTKTAYTLDRYGCGTPPVTDPKQMSWYPCNETFCLFNVSADPCEYHNLADAHPSIVTSMVNRLKDYQATAVSPTPLPSSCWCARAFASYYRPCLRRCTVSATVCTGPAGWARGLQSCHRQEGRMAAVRLPRRAHRRRRRPRGDRGGGGRDRGTRRRWLPRPWVFTLGY